MNGQSKNKNRYLSLGIIAAYLFMVGVNAAANIFKFNELTTGEVSDSYPNLFAPAGITFSIWGIIYLLLAVYVVYAVRTLWNRKEHRGDCRDVYFENVTFYFILSSISNAAWIVTWHFRLIFASVILMIVIFWSLYCVNAHAAKVYGNCCLKDKEQLFIRVPFGVYFGWITVALIANITVLLVSYGFDGGSRDHLFMDAILLVGVLISILVILKQSQLFFGLSVIWAYAGILIKHTSDAGFAGVYPDIILITTGSIIFLILTEIYLLRKNKLVQK
ncbi:MAG: tryptophan-rich sensory protein [Lachnospiraceae bacterium]|nr:tryptophan-rich sensory protein [Lachnospiraceae bacterium]